MKHTTLEDAVLSVIGEGNLEDEEITEPGTRDWGRLAKLERKAVDRRVTVTPILFAERRSPDQLPWSSYG